MGSVETTTNPSETPEGKQQQTERGEKTAENIRYGQGISEGGTTQGLDGSVDSEEKGEEGQARKAQGYGEGEGGDVDPSIGG